MHGESCSSMRQLRQKHQPPFKQPPSLPRPRSDRLCIGTFHPLLISPIPILPDLVLRQINIINSTHIKHNIIPAHLRYISAPKQTRPTILAKMMSPRLAPKLVPSDFVNARRGDQCECFGIARTDGEIPLFVADGAVAPAKAPGGGIGGKRGGVFDLSAVAGAGEFCFVGGGRHCVLSSE